MLKLPGLDRIGIQDALHGAAADRLVQFGPSAFGQIFEGLPTQGALGLSHGFAGQSGDQGAIEGGKGGLAPSAGLVLQSEIPLGPPVAPEADRVGMQVDTTAGLDIGERGLFVE